jgi:hypothetical protein
VTNPTRQQILNAHEALEELKNVALSAADFCGDTEKYLAWKSEIIAALPPRPQPTMADIEWDDELHHLAGAEHDAIGKVIMMHPASDAEIECLHEWYGLYRVYWLSSDQLTPTGKRYTLTEVQE